MFSRRLPALCFVGISAVFGQSSLAQDRFELEPINYSASVAVDPVAKLQAAIESGAATLTYDEKYGYLKSLLEHLQIPIESQVLVFSKTSLQADLISPTSPRAIYFNDDTYVGKVQHGAQLEISSTDPQLGTVFYTLSEQPADRPKLLRQQHSCLQCHAGSMTNYNPGHVVRSVYPNTDGFPILQAGTHITTQDSPMKERWGGWYVTGTHGSARHMGNAIATPTDVAADLDMEAGANKVTLAGEFDTSPYLSPDSDIVALMVLEHQAQVHNLMTEAGYESRRALREQEEMDRIFNRPAGSQSETTKRRIATVGDRLLRYMLCVDEPFLEAPVAGTSNFAETFTEAGPRDSKARTLRALDLKTRLFKYPLSYLIYSEQFDALPGEMQGYLYARLWAILKATPAPDDNVHLDSEQRSAILEILLETKRGLPDYWYGK